MPTSKYSSDSTVIFQFNLQKAIQASAVLLKMEGNRMTRLRLLKLLYIADRESLRERAMSITGDRPVAMDHGPVLTTVYSLIKGEDSLPPKWEKYIRHEGKHDVGLINDPGDDELSRYEIAKLQEVSSRLQDLNEWEVSEYTHTFPEWKRNKPPKKSVNPISIEDVLDAAGISKLKDQLIADARGLAAVDQILGKKIR